MKRMKRLKYYLYLGRQCLCEALLLAGVLERRWLWLITYRVSPALAGLCAILEGMRLPENLLFWVQETGTREHDADVDDMLEEISEMLQRAPVVSGNDDYLIAICQCGALSDEKDGISPRLGFEEIANSVPARRLIRRRMVWGKVWQDWKCGSGKSELRTVLEALAPTPAEPVTMIAVIAVGRVGYDVAARLNQVQVG